MNYWDEFFTIQNEALLSLDKAKIIEYMEKYSIPMPRNEKAFWTAVHKARLELLNLPQEEKIMSAWWLQSNR